jgi:hypothetical protein
VVAIPAFVVARRTGVAHPGEAFIPIVGSWIAILHSIRRSGWLLRPWPDPVCELVFYIWLVCVVPGNHGRTRWWILPFLIPFATVIPFWVYAFTLRLVETAATPGLDPTTA